MCSNLFSAFEDAALDTRQRHGSSQRATREKAKNRCRFRFASDSASESFASDTGSESESSSIFAGFRCGRRLRADGASAAGGSVCGPVAKSSRATSEAP